jgi:hypothetical protein
MSTIERVPAEGYAAHALVFEVGIDVCCREGITHLGVRSACHMTDAGKPSLTTHEQHVVGPDKIIELNGLVGEVA